MCMSMPACAAARSRERPLSLYSGPAPILPECHSLVITLSFSQSRVSPPGLALQRPGYHTHRTHTQQLSTSHRNGRPTPRPSNAAIYQMQCCDLAFLHSRCHPPSSGLSTSTSLHIHRDPFMLPDLVIEVDESGRDHGIEDPQVDSALRGSQPHAAAREILITRARGCPRWHAARRHPLHLCLERGWQRLRLLRLDVISADRARAMLAEPWE